MKIIIADDNPAVRATLKLLLSSHFEKVIAIADPTLLPAILSGGDVDAVLLDMNFLPGRLDCSDGIFWLQHIKELPVPPAVIMITAFGDLPIAVEAMKAGAADFITKPWDNTELIQKIHHAVTLNRESLQLKDMASKATDLEHSNRIRESMTISELKHDHAVSVVERCGGNLKAAAERLGVSRQTLYNILRKS